MARRMTAETYGEGFDELPGHGVDGDVRGGRSLGPLDSSCLGQEGWQGGRGEEGKVSLASDDYITHANSLAGLRSSLINC